MYPEVNVKPDWKTRVVRFESLKYTSAGDNPVAVVVNLDKRNNVTGWKVEY